jgi:phosphoribosylformylglycinamidine cyclo-ligase
VLTAAVSVELDWGAWGVPPIFALLQDFGQLRFEEMLRVFNLGLGLVFITPPGFDPRPACPAAMEIGRVIARGHDEERVILSQSPSPTPGLPSR